MNNLASIRLRDRSQQGSTLLLTIGTVLVIGIALASYLGLVQYQNRSAMRSQQWNASIPVLEAGIEEALTHLYRNGTNLAGNGWQLADGLFSKTRDLGENRYVVTLSTDARPVIVSRAYIRAPLSSNYITPPRTVRVTVTNSPLFAKGMVAKGQIDLSGNNVRTDSFDSADPAFSNNGRYDKNKAKDNGDVATNSAVVDSLNVWNADIFGRASTGPGGAVRVGANGSVGSKAWHDAGNRGIEPGWFSDDMNVQFPDVDVPFQGSAPTPTSGTVNGTNYTYVVGSGNWQLSSLNLSGQDKVLVTGNAVLYVTGNVSMTGQSSVAFGTSASLNLYVGGASASIGGNGVINSGNATNFYYWGLPGNTSLTLGGNAAFTGVIYAPQAAFTLGGGGNSDYDFVGASISDTVKMNGHFNFHYDENLRRVGPNRGFTVDSWNEVFNWEEL